MEVIADVIRVRVVGVVVERPVAERHGDRLPPPEVVVEEVRLVEVLLRSREDDHRADLDHLAGREVPPGEDAPPAGLR